MESNERLQKEILLKSVQDDKAEFIEEQHIQDDMFELYLKYNGTRFSISAHGNERWLMDEIDFITICEETS